MKKCFSIILMLCLLLTASFVMRADGILVDFSDHEVKVGDTFYVELNVRQSTSGVDIYLQYDDSMLKYNNEVTGGLDGYISFADSGRTIRLYNESREAVARTVTYRISFTAKAVGTTYVEVTSANVYDLYGDAYPALIGLHNYEPEGTNVYYSIVEIKAAETTSAPTTTEEETAQQTEPPTEPVTQPPTTEEPYTEAPTTEPPTTQAPATTAAPTTEAPTTTQRPPSSEARLSSLALVGGELSPAFSPNVYRYDLYVEHSTSALSVRYSPMDDHVQDAYYWPYVNAENGGIPVGDTEFTVRVIAEDGSSHDYVVMIHRAAPPTTAAPTTQPPATQPPTVPSTEPPTEPPTEPTTEMPTTPEETTEPSSETNESTEDPSAPDESSEPVTDDSGEETTPAETTEEVPEGDVIYRSSQVELKVLPIPEDLELPAGYEITEFTNEAGVPYQALIPSEGAKRQHCIFYGALVERDGDTYRLHEEGLYLFDIIGNTLQRYGMAVTPSTEPTTEESTTEAPPASEPGSSPAESKTEPAGTTVAPGTKASTNAPSSAQPGTTAQIPSSTSSGGDSRQTPSAGIPWWLWLVLLLLFALFILMLCLLLKARKELKEERTSNERLSPEEEDAFLAMNKGQLLEKARTANPPADPYAIDSVTVENLDDVIPVPDPDEAETEGTKE